MVDNTVIENIGLRVEKADEKGLFVIEEHEDFDEPNKFYVYIDEIDILIQKLRKAKHEWNHKNEFVQHSPHSASTHPNAIPKYKTFGDVNHFEAYRKYLRSDEWQQKRQERLQKDGFRCRNCGAVVGLEVHHKNYDNFGAESIEDLATLCKECHDKKTALDKKRRKGVVTDCG